LQSNQGFKRYFFNTSWLFFHQGVRLFVGFFVGLWLARYLGPEQFGIYNYVISYASVSLIFAKFGIEEILVKEFTGKTHSELSLLTASFWIRLIIGFISFSAVILTAIFIPSSKEIALYISIASLVTF